jgi:hypothetical protein
MKCNSYIILLLHFDHEILLNILIAPIQQGTLSTMSSSIQEKLYEVHCDNVDERSMAMNMMRDCEKYKKGTIVDNMPTIYRGKELVTAADNLTRQHIITELNMCGFPGEQLVDFIHNHKETTVISGSFALKYAIIEAGGDIELNPDDIDIFTTDPETLGELAIILAKSVGNLKHHSNGTGFNHTVTGSYTDITVGTNMGINAVHQFEVNKKIPKDKFYPANYHTTKPRGPISKLQLIILDNEVKNVVDFIKEFDMQFNRLYFNGRQIKYAFSSWKRQISQNMYYMSKSSHDIVVANRSIGRYEKYKSRGLNVILPERIYLTDPIRFTEEFIQNAFTGKLTPINNIAQGITKKFVLSKYYNIKNDKTLVLRTDGVQ